MKTSPPEELFKRYLQNECSAEELKELISFFGTVKEAELRSLIQQLLQTEAPVEDAALQQASADVFARISQHLQQQRKVVPAPALLASRLRIRRFFRVAAAAVLLFLLIGSLYYYLQPATATFKTARPVARQKAFDADTLPPGGPRAVLTLSDGRQIYLDKVQNGKIAREANTVIQKTADGRVIYERQGVEGGSVLQPTYNTLTTPRGGKFDLTLSDGTKVWLNAASSIRYPSAFLGNSRQVEITGEVYFEVAHQTKKPFRVKVADHEIEVLGTKFNVNAYNDEPAVKTTLLEGGVRIRSNGQSATLTPGQQAVVTRQSLHINPDADIEEAVAWHHGLFMFYDADIQTVMRQLSRWYNVDVRYEGSIPQRRFSGKIYRSISALKVADILRYKQIHFRIENHTIIVMP